MDEMISEFEKLGGSLNIDKIAEYEDAEVEAEYIINKGLTIEDKML